MSREDESREEVRAPAGLSVKVRGRSPNTQGAQVNKYSINFFLEHNVSMHGWHVCI